MNDTNELWLNTRWPGTDSAEDAAAAHSLRRPIQPTCWLSPARPQPPGIPYPQKRPIYVDLETGQAIGRSGPIRGPTALGRPNGRAPGMSFGLSGAADRPKRRLLRARARRRRAAASSSRRFDRSRRPTTATSRPGQQRRPTWSPSSPRRGWSGSIARPTSSSRGWPRGGPSSADDLTYTITLRPDLKFSDGAADDVRRRALLVSRRVRPRRGEPARLGARASTASRST